MILSFLNTRLASFSLTGRQRRIVWRRLIDETNSRALNGCHRLVRGSSGSFRAGEGSPSYHGGSKMAAAVPAMDVAMNANTSQSSLEM